MIKKEIKIGVFDSGLGGLFIADSIAKHLPDFNYVYLGDTLHLPYGKRSDQAIYDLSERAMRYLISQNCALVIMACNTASASALRKLQQEFLVREFPHHRILGVVVPTLEDAIDHSAHRIGLLATERTIASKIYDTELKKLNPDIDMVSVASPLLVPMIEDGGEKYLDIVLQDYLAPMKQAGVQSVILGCTHYVAIKHRVQKIMGPEVKIIAQDEIIPRKLADYLIRHPEIEERLSRTRGFEIHATDTNENYLRNIKDMMGDKAVVRMISI